MTTQKQPIKLALINNLYPPNILGGAERSVQLLAEALVQLGLEVVVIASADESSHRWQNGVSVYNLKLRNLYGLMKPRQGPLQRLAWHVLDSHNPAMARQVGEILDHEAPALVHTHVIAGFSVKVWSEARRRNIPLVHTLRDYYLLCPRSTMYNHQRNCDQQCTSCAAFSALKKPAAPDPNAVVGISDFILRRHRRHGWFVNTPRRVIFNAAETSPHPSDPHSSLGTGSSSQDPTLRLGYLGRLHPSKGVEQLLRSFSHLVQRSPAKLAIAGRGEPDDEARLHALAKNLPVQFLGFCPPTALFSQIDVLVAPSLWHEPLGRVVLEAQAHGIPVLGARRGGITEIIDEKKTGWLFDPDLAGDLDKKLSDISDQRSALPAMRQACLDASQNFSPRAIAEQYLDLYRDLLSPNRPPARSTKRPQQDPYFKNT